MLFRCRGIGRLLLVTALAACHQGGVPAPPVSVACPSPAAPDPAWPAADLGAFSIHVPPEFARDSTYPCGHGGEYWRDGQNLVGYCNGWYAATAAPTANEQLVIFLGATALLHCNRWGSRWYASLVPTGAGFRMAAGAQAADRQLIAQLIGALLEARSNSQ